MAEKTRHARPWPWVLAPQDEPPLEVVGARVAYPVVSYGVDNPVFGRYAPPLDI